jgi:uncharacterized protein DUF2855
VTKGLDFLVDRSDLRRTSVASAQLPDGSELLAGEVLLEIEKYGFSANNVTYATLGETMGYWRFFPASDGWGRVPVWGYARVAASAHDELAPGERVFGYLPMSTHVVLLADRVGAEGFVDAARRRADLPAAYQRYTRLGPSGWSSEDQQALWRPLFMTSFGAADFLADRELFGAERVVISSASSKTAMGSAFLLGSQLEGIDVVGLTSPGKVEFTEGTGYYASVHAYDDLEQLPADAPLVFVDFAGNDRLVADLHRHAADQLKQTVVVGATHWEERDQGGPLDGGDSDFFFLPPWMDKRRGEWGPGEFARRYDEAWETFLPTVERWMRVEHHSGPAAVEAVYRGMLEGKVDPSVGHMLSLHD